jgi:predicted O-linked N-acetylglucosamine transferase (SPINDLY family)/predicted SAM-dependent methyltransferase
MNPLTRARNSVAAFFLKRLGHLLTRRGVSGGAGWYFQEAQSLSAAEDSGVYEIAKSCWLDGDFDTAKRLLNKFVITDPGHAKARNLLGVVTKADGQLEEAEACFNQAILLSPDWAAPRNNLGSVFLDRDDFPSAERCFRNALECDAEYVEALNNLGLLLNRTGKYDEAERLLREALRLKPDFAGAANNLGSALMNQGRFADGIAQYREALRLQPDLIEANINLGVSLEEPARLVGAMDHFHRMLERKPDSYIAMIRLAQAHIALQEWGKAEDLIRRALAISPETIDTYNLLAVVSSFQGDARATADNYLKAMELGGALGLRSCYLFHRLYDPACTAESFAREAQEWDKTYIARMGSTAKDLSSYPNVSEPNIKMRIGYISKDFRRHSVMFFFEPIISNHDHRYFEIYCYANLHHQDVVTERYKRLAHGWRDIALMNDEDLINKIREDRIDILVDLSGHTTGSRLPAMMRRPAPIQINYLGYPATTGLSAIDYRMVDALTDPPGVADQYHSERLLRLNDCFLTYRPEADAPAVVAPPCLTSGYVTFGSFNNLLKLNEKVAAAWARILRGVPGSRLMLKSSAFESGRAKQRLIDMFAAEGIDESRLELIKWQAVGSHLDSYAKIDIGLDPFPYNGTTTTCETLWMGVPVVTLAGERHSSRVGVSLLMQVGLPELICDSLDAYVQTAMDLALDPQRLVSLRSSLRERMQASPLLDHAGFTRKLEAAYRHAWADTLGCPAVAPADAEDELRLHIGGLERKKGWKILNANPGDHVDFLGDIADLSAFAEGSVAEIYASHVLEHVDQKSMLGVLKGIHRVLRTPGGRLMISVPDLDALCELYLSDKNDRRQRVHAMQMMFGAQTDQYDYHYIGLDFGLLSDFLHIAGFRDICRVKSFGLFNDTSEFAPYGRPISLNVAAVKG